MTAAAAFYCEHPPERLSAPRRRTIAGGCVQYRLQCEDCGAAVGGAVGAARAKGAQPFDENLFAAGIAREDAARETREAERQATRAADLAAWREGHDAYLQTDEWRARREKVLERCGYCCEGCGERPAVLVHHLTYDHHRRELLFELVGLCRECHDIAHNLESAK